MSPASQYAINSILTYCEFTFEVLPCDSPIAMEIGVVFYIQDHEEYGVVNIHMRLVDFKKKYPTEIANQKFTGWATFPAHRLLAQSWIEEVYKGIVECPIKALTHENELARYMASYFIKTR